MGDPALSRAARRGILVLGMHRGGTSDEFLSAELRHHMLDENEIGTLPEARWLSPTISALRAIAQSGDDPQSRRLLDAVYADCRANFAVLGGSARTSHE